MSDAIDEPRADDLDLAKSYLTRMQRTGAGFGITGHAEQIIESLE